MNEFHNLVFAIEDKNAVFIVGLRIFCRRTDKLPPGKIVDHHLVTGKGQAISLYKNPVLVKGDTLANFKTI